MSRRNMIIGDIVTIKDGNDEEFYILEFGDNGNVLIVNSSRHKPIEIKQYKLNILTDYRFLGESDDYYDEI